MPRGAKIIGNMIESLNHTRSLSIEKMVILYTSLQEIVINMQSEIHACKERELNLKHAVEIQNIDMKSWKEELHVMKNWMLELESKMLNLEVEKEKETTKTS